MEERTINPNTPADYAHPLGDYKNLRPFRYWCQKVLPLVYDDSLSYYELLCKVVDYLNKTMEDVETLHVDVTNLHTAYIELQNYVNNYFKSLDVQKEINNKLDSMAKDGSLSNLLKPLVNANFNEVNKAITNINNDISNINTRIDSFTKLNEGSTTGDAELIDGRDGFLGNKYPNIGTAIREQNESEFNAIINNYNGAIKEKSIIGSDISFINSKVTSRNIYNNKRTVKGFEFNAVLKNGSYLCNPNSIITDFYDVDINENNEWVFSISHGTGVHLCIAFYDENYTLTGFDYIENITSTDPDIEDGSNKYFFPIHLRTKLSGKKIRLSWRSEPNEIVQLENNPIVTFYKEYSESIEIPDIYNEYKSRINSNVNYEILKGVIDSNNNFVATDQTYIIRMKCFKGITYYFNCPNSTILRISGYLGFQSGVNSENTYEREFDKNFAMLTEEYSNYELTLDNDYEIFAYFGEYNFKNFSISDSKIYIKQNNTLLNVNDIFEPKSLFWKPINGLVGGTKFDNPFFLYTDTGYDLYVKIYDELCDKHPDDLKRVNIGTGYDASNTYPMYAYIHEPQFYEQTIILQSGAHASETFSWMCLARFVQLLFEQHENHEWLSYLWYNCKIVIVPCVNVWGASQEKHTDKNSEGISVQRNITAGTPINPTEKPIQETLNMREFYSKYGNEASIFIDIHQSGRYTNYGNYCIAVSDENPASRASKRVITNLCKRHFGSGGKTVYLPSPADPGINTYRNYMQTNYDLCAVTCELSLSGWSELAYEPIKFEMGCEYIGNLLIELLKLKYKTIK